LPALALLAAGCSSIGPGTIGRDRVDYAAAIGDSWKNQTLLNIVRLRYGDAPVFLDVSSIIGGYGLQASATAAGMVSTDRTTAVPYGTTTLGATGTYLDRPTISYTPLAGQRFTNSLLRPLPPRAVFELVQAGYPADFILLVTTRAINGVYNRSSLGGGRAADGEFYPVLDALRRLQASGSVSVRMVRRGGEEVALLLLTGARSAAVEEDLRLVARVLRVQPDANGEMTLGFGAVQRAPNELALLTRSMLEMLVELASGIDVPAGHVAEGRASPTARLASAADPRDRPIVRVSSGPSPPGDAFAAARHRDTWFWIDDRDFASKRIFSVLMLFFSLAEAGTPAPAPVLTIPAN
jgi:hypothetical protein